MTEDWDRRLRTLIRAADPGSTFALSIRTSNPIAAWLPSNVTLVGDAIHTMTPGRGAGANTALRDAQLLCDNLISARDGDRQLLEAVGGYETKMREYSALAVKESLEFMNDNGTARKPVIGPVSTFATRSLLRVTNRVPAMKRRMAMGFQRVRDSEQV
jgi:2-polyprenyl-6-methoxyphenol hydroxylase-like FAD-dependent oxidoreductase